MAFDGDIINVEELNSNNLTSGSSGGGTAIDNISLFVSPTGDDTNNGSSSSPFQTITRAVEAISFSGYNESAVINVETANYSIPGNIFLGIGGNGERRSPVVIKGLPRNIEYTSSGTVSYAFLAPSEFSNHLRISDPNASFSSADVGKFITFISGNLSNYQTNTNTTPGPVSVPIREVVSSTAVTVVFNTNGGSIPTFGDNYTLSSAATTLTTTSTTVINTNMPVIFQDLNITLTGVNDILGFYSQNLSKVIFQGCRINMAFGQQTVTFNTPIEAGTDYINSSGELQSNTAGLYINAPGTTTTLEINEGMILKYSVLVSDITTEKLIIKSPKKLTIFSSHFEEFDEIEINGGISEFYSVNFGASTCLVLKNTTANANNLQWDVVTTPKAIKITNNSACFFKTNDRFVEDNGISINGTGGILVDSFSYLSSSVASLTLTNTSTDNFIVIRGNSETILNLTSITMNSSGSSAIRVEEKSKLKIPIFISGLFSGIIAESIATVIDSEFIVENGNITVFFATPTSVGFNFKNSRAIFTDIIFNTISSGVLFEATENSTVGILTTTGANYTYFSTTVNINKSFFYTNASRLNFSGTTNDQTIASLNLFDSKVFCFDDLSFSLVTRGIEAVNSTLICGGNIFVNISSGSTDNGENAVIANNSTILCDTYSTSTGDLHKFTNSNFEVKTTIFMSFSGIILSGGKLITQRCSNASIILSNSAIGIITNITVSNRDGGGGGMIINGVNITTNSVLISDNIRLNNNSPITDTNRILTCNTGGSVTLVGNLQPTEVTNLPTAGIFIDIDNAKKVFLRGVTFDGFSSSNRGIDITRCQNVILDNVSCSNFTQFGVRLDKCRAVITNVTGTGNGTGLSATRNTTVAADTTTTITGTTEVILGVNPATTWGPGVGSIQEGLLDTITDMGPGPGAVARENCTVTAI